MLASYFSQGKSTNRQKSGIPAGNKHSPMQQLMHTFPSLCFRLKTHWGKKNDANGNVKCCVAKSIEIRGINDLRRGEFRIEESLHAVHAATDGNELWG